MSRKTMATAVLLVAAMTAQADVGISADVITTGNEIKVLRPGPDLHALIKNIVDNGSPAADNPYLIKLGPGEYTILPNPDDANNGLVMKPHISIVGSGRGVTILKGTISTSAFDPSSAIVSCASDTILTDLSVENDGATTYSFGIQNIGGANLRIERVDAKVSGAAQFNYAIHNGGSPDTTTMTDVTATASNGTNNLGVYNRFSSLAMIAITAKGKGGDRSYGVYNFSSSPMMTEVVAEGSGADGNRGVLNQDASSPTMMAVTATATGGSTSYGVYNVDSASAPRIERSSLSGDTYAIVFTGSTGTRISNSRLVGGFDADPTPAIEGDQCRDNYDENLANVTC